LIVPVLIGPQQKIQAVAAEAGLSLQDVELLDVLPLPQHAPCNWPPAAQWKC
jgi:phosphotransacetylase